MLEKLVEMSNRYGSNPEFVLAGGGNTSFKDEETLYVKGSGKALADVTADDFVSMDRSKLSAMLRKDYPKDDDSREAAALNDMMAAKLPGNEDKRPSVEAPLHNLFQYKYVLHVHPALINGLTCGKNGEAEARRLIGDELVWVPLSRPGYALSVFCYEKMKEYTDHTGKNPRLVLLQNHGIFAAGDTVEDVDKMMLRVMSALEAHISSKPDMEPINYDKSQVEKLRSQIEGLYSQAVSVDFVVNKQILKYIASQKDFEPLSSSFTPDHIVYCKAKFMYIERIGEMSQMFELFVRDNGYLPKVICIKNVGAFIIGSNEKEMVNARELFLDAVKVAAYSENFGGFLHMTDDLVHFILNWEAEAYRQKVAAK